MNPVRVHAAVLAVLLASACATPRPQVETMGAEVPAAPLLKALEERRASFPGLRALASAQVTRKGRTLAFDSVGVVVKPPDRFRLEAYGPLGQSLVEITGTGGEVRVVRAGMPVSVNEGGLERYLGADVAPAELAAVLAGVAPLPAAAGVVRAFCNADGCVLEQESGALVRRVRTAAGDAAIPASYELWRGAVLLYRARFERPERAGGYVLPRTISLESPERKAGMVLTYEEADTDPAIDDRLFTGREGER